MTPEEHWNWTHHVSQECSEIEIMELVKLAASRKKVIVDTNIPPEILREISDYSHVAIMLCDPPDICAERFFNRDDPDKKFMMDQIKLCRDPEAALKNFNSWALYHPPIETDWYHAGFFTYGILILYEHENNTFIKMEHDLKFESIKNQMDKQPFISQINKSIFQFLNSNGPNYISSEFSESDLNDSIAFHAYKSQIGNWQTLNLNCGIHKYKMGLYENASIFFDRLENYYKNLENKLQIIIADCYFENGNYSKAQTILYELYQKEDYNFDFEDYCLYARIENILINPEHSYELADKAGSLSNITETMKIKANRIKQQSLINQKERNVIQYTQRQ